MTVKIHCASSNQGYRMQPCVLFLFSIWRVLLALWLYLPSSGKHEGCCTPKTSRTCQWLIISLFGLFINAARTREGPIAFGFGAAASHFQPQDIIFLASEHSMVKCNSKHRLKLCLLSGT